MAKLHVTELQNRVIDACLQLHGGYGYMWEYPVARAWADSRISRIYGGSSEVMKELIGRTL
jgi:acyl-CoA dehydrogenase